MDVREWKDALLKLDVNRECTAETSADGCWLCDCLRDWNCVLNALGLDLAEEQLGRLCLSTQVAECGFDMGDAPFSTADFIVWLPRKHWCIEALRLGKGKPSCSTVVVPDSVAGRLTKLRSIVLEAHTQSDTWVVVLDALGPIDQLEKLEVSTFPNEDLALRLARLMATSAGSMTSVDLLGGHIWSGELDILMCGISKCLNLTKLRFCARFNLTGLADFTNWLRSTETLELLCIEEDPGDPDDPTIDNDDDDDDDEDDKIEIDSDENNEELFVAIVDLLRRNTSLQELRYQRYRCSGLEKAFQALETNTMLRRLIITGGDFDVFRNDTKMGIALRSLLLQNEALQSLTFESCTMSVKSAILISEGLRKNRTLEVLDVSACDLEYPVVIALCSALKENTTLHSLRFGPFSASRCMRQALSAEVKANGWYKRLRMPWPEWDVPGLEASLGCPLQCPSDLEISTGHFNVDSFATLCTALCSSLHLRSLTVELIDYVPRHIELLYDVLSSTKSLRRVVLQDGPGEVGCAVAMSQGLCHNRSVTELAVKCGGAGTLCTEAFAIMLSSNETLSKVAVTCDRALSVDFVRSVSQALLLNKVITDFSLLQSGNVDCSTQWTRSAVQRNRSRLHRAVRFVLKKNVGKECAEAFEHFEGKPSLVPCVMSTAGMSQAEAESAVKAARQFIPPNYLVISGVIRSNLECNEGRGMQIDQLNIDCWLAIAKYLKVSDVIEKLEV